MKRLVTVCFAATFVKYTLFSAAAASVRSGNSEEIPIIGVVPYPAVTGEYVEQPHTVAVYKQLESLFVIISEYEVVAVLRFYIVTRRSESSGGCLAAPRRPLVYLEAAVNKRAPSCFSLNCITIAASLYRIEQRLHK